MIRFTEAHMALVISILGSLALIAIIVGGLALIVAPSAGRGLLKNTAVALGLALAGSCLLQACCGMLHW